MEFYKKIKGGKKMKKFEDMTIRELKRLTEEFQNQNPRIQTAQELLDEKFEEGKN